MAAEQTFVGGVAIILGGILLFAAIRNLDASFHLPKFKWLEARIGRTASRMCCAAIGVGLIILGLVIAMGVGRTGNP